MFKLGEYEARVEKRISTWRKHGFIRRLWDKDPSLWFPKAEPEIIDRLGWLSLPETTPEMLDEYVSFADDVKKEGISRVVLLGMGGSSLAPEVFQKTFGNEEGFPELTVLDSTHPEAVLELDKALDPNQTLFVVSSKSGTTLETLSLFRYFWNRMSNVTQNPGCRFVAITDPGSPLDRLGNERNFRAIFQAPSEVGGRYSALSVFGIVPAALIGMDIHKLLDRAWIASENSAFSVSEENAAGLILGAALGELAAERDKLTIFSTNSLNSFPDWLEQLIAESTGKMGKGIVPIVSEPLLSVDSYRKDRFFIGFALEEESRQDLDKRFEELEYAGHPTILFNLSDKFDLGQEIFLWEIAIASAGSVLGIHPFNQPDVHLAKDLAREAMQKQEKKDQSQVEIVSVKKPEILAELIEMWIQQAKEGDYLAIQAYLAPHPDISAALQRIRFELLSRTGKATTLGYGPRFLHSTGQLHKGGPNRGLFLQIVDESGVDLAVPETDFTFGELIRAQALGDYHALKQRGRRIIRVNLGDDVVAGIKQLEAIIRA